MLFDLSQVKDGDEIKKVITSAQGNDKVLVALRQAYAELTERMVAVEKELDMRRDSAHELGMVLLQEGSRVGKWVRVDSEYNLATFDATVHGTWADMKTVVTDHGDFVEIPTTWVRTEILETGPYAGRPCWWIADHAENGYHVHPALMKLDGTPGKLQVAAWITSMDDNGLPYSSDVVDDYLSYWNGVAYTEVHGLCQALNTNEDNGYRPYSIYDHHLLARMMLVEYGTSDVQSLTVNDVKWDGSKRIAYHDIHDPFGTPDSEFLWLDGFSMVNGVYNVLANDGSGDIVDTGIACLNDGTWMRTCMTTVVDRVDFNDLFIANEVNGTENNASFADRQSLNTNYACCLNWQRSSRRGAFCLGGHPVNYTNSMLGWRFVRVV